MPLVPPARSLTKDAVLLYGGMGGGKTTAYLQLAKWYRSTATPGHFHVLCTELESVLRCAEEYDDVLSSADQPFSNLTILQADNYDTLVSASQKAHENATADDWLICDSLSDPQEWARDTFFLPQLGMTWAEFARSGRKMLDVPSHGWKQMRETYNDWFQRYFLRWPGHRFATARSKKLDYTSPWANNEAGERKRSEYGHIGYGPVGNDQIGYAFHTVLYSAQSGPKTRTLTTAKDRAREYLVDHEWRNFVLDYLVPAGWQFTQES